MWIYFPLTFITPTFSLEEKVAKRGVLFANLFPCLFQCTEDKETPFTSPLRSLLIPLGDKETIAHPLIASGYSFAKSFGEKHNFPPHLEMASSQIGPPNTTHKSSQWLRKMLESRRGLL